MKFYSATIQINLFCSAFAWYHYFVLISVFYTMKFRIFLDISYLAAFGS